MKYVLVTGAGSGLGYELTRMYAERGDFVFACDVVISERLTELGQKFPEGILVEECDISSTESVERAIARAAEITSRIEDRKSVV